MKLEIKQCRDCRRPVVWMKTLRGKNIPVDPHTLSVSDTAESTYDSRKHGCHYSTCVVRLQHRRIGDAA